MPNQIQDLHKVDADNFPYIYEENATVTLKSSEGLVRVNFYRPKTDKPVPVLVTYGPYGKDIPHEAFFPQSFSEVNPEQKSAHSAWKTPDLGFWTSQGYAVVRADERRLGQSPGEFPWAQLISSHIMRHDDMSCVLMNRRLPR